MLAILLLSLFGCASKPPLPMPANFAHVEGSIYRGGQPSESGWLYLKSIGISNVVKLNTQSEASDDYATSLGMDVWNAPINLYQQVGFGRITLPPWIGNLTNGVYIHCEHGQDRTGLAVAIRRVRNDHWTKAAAEKEMLAHGFHKSLVGLWDYWQEFGE